MRWIFAKQFELGPMAIAWTVAWIYTLQMKNKHLCFKLLCINNYSNHEDGEELLTMKAWKAGTKIFDQDNISFVIICLSMFSECARTHLSFNFRIFKFSKFQTDSVLSFIMLCSTPIIVFWSMFLARACKMP